MSDASQPSIQTDSPRVNLRGRRTFSVAPMMAWTTADCRYFHRLLSKNVLLYTEMVTTGALIHGDVPHHLAYNDEEHPLALQLGGSDPADLAKCTKLAKQWGYDEVNLNVGCPSDRVQNGSFGACLMAEPILVRDCMSAMRDAADIDVTVKHRIGIDDKDSYDAMAEFVGIVAESGVDTFIVHARNAILEGLSPKENREIPPLKYDYVYRLKQEFPELEILINGGIKTHDECAEHLKHVDGVMLGREAYHNPWVLSEVDSRYYGESDRYSSRRDIIDAILPYVEQQVASGERLFHITRHMMGLFTGVRGTKPWKRYLADHARKPEANAQTLADSIAHAFGDEIA